MTGASDDEAQQAGGRPFPRGRGAPRRNQTIGTAALAMSPAHTRKGAQPSVPIHASSAGPSAKPMEMTVAYTATVRPRLRCSAMWHTHASPAIQRKLSAIPRIEAQREPHVDVDVGWAAR